MHHGQPDESTTTGNTTRYKLVLARQLGFHEVIEEKASPYYN